MLLGFLKFLYMLNGLFLILIILLQQGKGGLGIGAIGGASQMIFGGSGGADLFQKITWVSGSIFMVGALVLSLLAAQQTVGTLPTPETPEQQQSQA